MTTAPRGARPVAPKTNPTTSTPNSSPNSSTSPSIRVASDDDIVYLAGRVRDGHPLSPTARQALAGAGSNAPAPDGLGQDLGVIGATFRTLARATLERDADRTVVLTQALDIANGRLRLDADAWRAFQSRLHHLRGAVPAELAQALDVAAAANWAVVAERLFAAMRNGVAR